MRDKNIAHPFRDLSAPPPPKVYIPINNDFSTCTLQILLGSMPNVWESLEKKGLKRSVA